MVYYYIEFLLIATDISSLLVVSVGSSLVFVNYTNFVLQPNCTAEIVNIEGKKKILIISQQKIVIGEEVSMSVLLCPFVISINHV